MGFYISFAGNVTFKKAGGLRDVAKTVPLDRILVETDCPFMSPGDFGEATTRNFERLFGVSIN